MMFTLILGAVVILVLVIWLLWDPYPDIPGPSIWNLLWNYDSDSTKMHLNMAALQLKYGPIFKVPRLGNDPLVILSDYESIIQVSVKDGKLFGGRTTNFRIKTVTANTGILLSHNPDETWKNMRKTTQRHLRQFGDGLSRLEAIIVDIAEDMFLDLEEHAGKAYNPGRIVFDTALNSIAFLLIGKRTEIGEPVVEKMREYESLFLKTLPTVAPVSVSILDVCPWLRHFGLKSWNLFTRTLEVESEIWQAAKEYADKNPDAESIYKVFNDQLQTGTSTLTKEDAIKATLSLILAGVATTSATFYAAINILAHHKDIQDKLFEEAEMIKERTGSDPSLKDRPDMHFSRAVLFELLRYVSPVPTGVAHRSLEKTRIRGYNIPANTTIFLLIWNLHHDAKTWENPYRFCPERFLDQDGKVVAADHRNRKNLMPFGAGPRVCLGEFLAMTRLFLWLTTLIQRFRILPAPNNDPSTADARQYKFEGVFRPTPYEVMFEKRI